MARESEEEDDRGVRFVVRCCCFGTSVKLLIRTDRDDEMQVTFDSGFPCQRQNWSLGLGYGVTSHTSMHACMHPRILHPREPNVPTFSEV